MQDVAAAGGNPEYCQVVDAVQTHGEAGRGSAGFFAPPAEAMEQSVCIYGLRWLLRLNQTGIVTPSLSVNTFDSGEVLNKGFAVVNTDTGHEPIAGSNLSIWALLDVGVPNKPARFDNLHRAVHDVTVAAKQLVTAYYNGDISFAYFDGCSTGGRQGMVEAIHYPDDYDGII